MLRNATVLIVDDDPFSRTIVSKKLKSFTRVVEASDGEEALRLVGCASIDLVIADLDMPRLDGLQLVRAMRGTPSMRHIPVIILTAAEAPDLPQKSVVAGSTSFLRKPLNWEAFGDHVRHVLEIAFRSNHLAFHDTLTRLPNRAFLEPRHAAALEAARSGSMVATYALDLDGFKAVNDTLGHPAGDELLRAVANHLRSIVTEHDTIARVGGDEFIVIQTRIADVGRIEQFAQSIISVLSAPYILEGRAATIGVSIGIDVAEQSGRTSAAAIRNADVALYRSKRGGKGMWQVFAEIVAPGCTSSHHTANALKQAIRNDELLLCYQPVFQRATGDIVSLEALVRWRHSDAGLIMPETILQCAQQASLLPDLDAWVVKRACTDAARWRGRWQVAVNITSEFLASAAAVDTVEDALQQSGLPATQLAVEFAEAATAHGTQVQTLALLHKLGVELTIDDYGIGTCSITALSKLPIKAVKVDYALVSGCARSPTSHAMLAAVMAMAPILNFKVGAVGIETAETFAKISDLSIDHLQGHLMCEPVEASEIGAWASERAQLPTALAWRRQA